MRDRLSELKQAQAKSGTVSIELENKTPADSSELRKTFEQSEVISQWIECIDSNLEEAKQQMKKLNDPFQKHKDTAEKLQSLFQKNNTVAHQISTKLKEIETTVEKININTAEGRIKLMQYNALKTRFQQAFMRNSNELENYRNIQKHLIQQQLNARGQINVTDEELTAFLDQGKDVQVFVENIIAETAEVHRILAEVEDRHNELLKIESMLTEVRDLFVQMSILVDNQQELIDRVEYQVQTATDYVGAVDMGEIRRSKKKYMKRKIYIGLIVAVIVIILLALIFKS